MNRVSDYFSPQAKAVVSALMVLLAQIIAFVGTGGWSVLVTLTLGNWLGIAMATLLAWGFTYNVPNTPATVPVPTVIADGIRISEEAETAKHDEPKALCNSPVCSVVEPHIAH